MTQEAPRFSVVIPTQGRASLRDAVDSVLNQTEPSFELIVVTDGDANLTEQHLANVSDPRVRRVSQPPKGVCAARNLGVAQSRGRWITFLDDDDTARPDWLATWRSAIQPGTSVVTGSLAYHDETGTRDVHCKLDPSDRTADAAFLLAGGFAVTADLFHSVGGYDEQLRYFENFDLGLRLCDQIATAPAECVVNLAHVVGDIHVEASKTRLDRHGDARGAAANRILERHSARFARKPGSESGFLRVLSRSLRLNSNFSGALHTAVRACRGDWRDANNWKSAAAALVSPGVALVHRLVERRPARSAQ